MTSGTFHNVEVSSIFVNRESRQRRELTNIDELAESIHRHGLIHPPVIKRDGELIVGERRFTAIKKLGWTHMPVQYIDELPEQELRAVELEENLRRVDILWQDECEAVAQYHDLRAAEAPDWTYVQTASALGMSDSEVYQKTRVAQELRSGNQRVLEAPKYSTARGIVERSTERQKAAAIEAIEGPKQEVEEVQSDVPLLNLDFHEWQPRYTGPKFNLIHCDFPYGIKANKHNQGAAASFGGYADDPDIYWQLIARLGDAMENVVADSAHLIFWFSMDYYERTREALAAMGWSVNPFPLVWFKSDNTGILPDPNRGPRRLYETALFASRGDRKIVSAVGNCTAASTTKTVHMSEKSLPMLKHFMRMVVDEHSQVLDPTAGSCNALKAAASLGAGKVLGLEQSPEFHRLAKEHWND